MASLFVFAVTFCVYAWTASPSIGWLDSPEFVASAVSLGVAHSPGHPIPALIGWFGTLLPVGDVVFRVNLMSAVTAAGAAVAMYHAAHLVLGQLVPTMGASIIAVVSCSAAFVFAFSFASWGQAVRAEVYGLQSLLIVSALAAVLAFDATENRRWLYLAGFVCGLALANHHFIAILFLFPAAVIVFARHRNGQPGWLGGGVTALLGIVGLAALLYLPVRAAQHPVVNWGAPDTAERFAWTVSAKAFQKSVHNERVSPPGEDAMEVVLAVADNASILLALMALIGLYFGITRHRVRRRTCLLIGIVVTSCAGRVLIGFDGDTPDHHGYLVAAVVGLMLLGVMGFGVVGNAVGRDWFAKALAGILVVTVPLQAWQNADVAKSRHSYAADTVAYWELSQLPSRSIALLSYFQSSFRVWGLRVVEQSRPDVVLLDRSFLTYPGGAREAKFRNPELSKIIDAPLKASWPTPKTELLAQPRPVFIQLHFNLEEDIHRFLLPLGSFARLEAVVPNALLRQRAEQRDLKSRTVLRRVLAQSDALETVGVRDTLLWYDTMAIDFYCGRHQLGAAQLALESAFAIAPRDRHLKRLAADCGLSGEK